MQPEKVVVIGGGVIGLSIAWELLRAGRQVVLLDRAELAGQASAAGAGILAPGHPEQSLHPVDRWLGRSRILHREWSQELEQETGQSTGLLECGGVYLAFSRGEAAALAAQAGLWQEEQIDVAPIPLANLASLLGREFLPAVPPTAAWSVPIEGQIVNLLLLRTLELAILQRGGEIRRTGSEVPSEIGLRWQSGSRRITAIRWQEQWIEGDWFCLTAGAWTGQLASSLGWHLPTVPVRGQMIRFQLPQRPFLPIVNCGSRYVVPRSDGTVLVGSTMEEAGFDSSTTEDGIAGLQAFAESLFPAWTANLRTGTWAGLRPGTPDGLPALGRIPDCENGLVAAGHLRAGLQLAPSTAVLIRGLIEGQEIPAELASLVDPGRFQGS